MAAWSCRKTRQILDNLPKIIGVEYLLAARAIYLKQEPLGGFKLGKGSQAAYDALSTRVPFSQEDSYMQNQIKPALEAAASGEILDIVEGAVGALNWGARHVRKPDRPAAGQDPVADGSVPQRSAPAKD